MLQIKSLAHTYINKLQVKDQQIIKQTNHLQPNPPIPVATACQQNHLNPTTTPNPQPEQKLTRIPIIAKAKPSPIPNQTVPPINVVIVVGGIERFDGETSLGLDVKKG